VKGRGKSTSYWSSNDNPLLRVIDSGQYFLVEADEREGAREKFDFAVFDSLKNLLTQTEIVEIGKKTESFDKRTKNLEEDILKRELERFMIELSWKSSKIEGNTYDLLETETLIKEQREAQGKSREEAVMILNHKQVFETILKNKNQFKKVSLSQINQLHGLMIADLGVTTGIRKQSVGITGTVYRPLDNQFQLREAVEKMVTAINDSENPLEKALIVVSMVSYVQPFAAGNKRTGRMLANAILLAHDFFPLSYRSVSESEFKRSLVVFYEQLSIYQLKQILIEQLFFACKNYFR